MEEIDHKQLAYLLKISPNDARRMMIAAWCKSSGETPNIGTNGKKKSVFLNDDYPRKMNVQMLAKNLNLPHLPMAIEDIRNNYLTKPATRGYILNYPLAMIQKRMEESTDPYELKFPIVLRTFLNPIDVDEILQIWGERYGAQYPWVVFT